MASVRSMPGLQKFNVSSPEYRAKVPSDVAAKVKGRRVTFSFPAAGNSPEAHPTITLGTHAKVALRTFDPTIQVARTALAIAQLEAVYGAARHGPQPLTQRQRVALSGEVYRMFVEVYRDEPGEPSDWACLKGLNRAVREGRITDGDVPTLDPQHSNDVEVAQRRFGIDLTAGINDLPMSALPHDAALERRFGMLATLILNRHGIETDAASRRALLVEVEKASTDAAWALKRASEGDYTPDPKAQRFPAFEAASTLTMTSIFDEWEKRTKPSPNTLMTWTGCFKSLRAFLGHDDARRITKLDLQKWKNSLLDKGLKPKTVNDSHLCAVRSVLAYAVTNNLLSGNPATGVRAVVKVEAGEDAEPYTDSEIARLLDCARRQDDPKKRWLILLAVTTGARIGELSQLWGEHIREEEGVMRISIEPTKDGGRLKNAASKRKVPLHPEVVSAGFLDFVRSKGDGPLFYDRTSGDSRKRHASKGVANHLGSWVKKQKFTNNARVAPLHGCRHWWKSAAFRAGIQDSLADRIQGHGRMSKANRYRTFNLETMAAAVASVPLPKVNPSA